MYTYNIHLGFFLIIIYQKSECKNLLSKKKLSVYHCNPSFKKKISTILFFNQYIFRLYYSCLYKQKSEIIIICLY